MKTELELCRERNAIIRAELVAKQEVIEDLKAQIAHVNTATLETNIETMNEWLRDLSDSMPSYEKVEEELAKLCKNLDVDPTDVCLIQDTVHWGDIYSVERT